MIVRLIFVIRYNILFQLSYSIISAFPPFLLPLSSLHKSNPAPDLLNPFHFTPHVQDTHLNPISQLDEDQISRFCYMKMKERGLRIDRQIL